MRQYLLLLFILLSSSLLAQSPVILLFSEYTNGTVFMRNHQKIHIPINYDAGNKRMMFSQQGNDMVLTNVQMVDSIYIGEHYFIPFNKGFLERRIIDKDTLLIDWKLENAHVGYRGAYGQTSQVRSHSVNLYSISGIPYEATNTVSNTDIYKKRIRNTYYLFMKQRLVKYKKGTKRLSNISLDKAIEAIEHEHSKIY